jgi:choice-of-anchor C domain-containing protein
LQGPQGQRVLTSDRGIDYILEGRAIQSGTLGLGETMHLIARSIGATTAAVAAAIALPVSGLASSGVTNGSFENGNYVNGGNGFETLAAGTVNAGAITDWTVTSGTIDWVSTYWTAEDGSLSLDMNGTPTADVASPVGTISQTLETTVNNTYVVQFFLAGNPTCGPSTKSMTVTATGSVPQDYSFTNTSATTRTNMGWEPEVYSFVAMGASATLTFAADPSNTSNCGPVLDAVSTTELVAAGEDCKKDGWRTMFEADGTPFKNQGDCVSFYATSGATPIGPPTSSATPGTSDLGHGKQVAAVVPQISAGAASHRGKGSSHGVPDGGKRQVP